MKRMKMVLLSAVLALGMSLTACGDKEAGISVEEMETIYEEKNIAMPSEVMDGVEYKTSVEVESRYGIYDFDNIYADVEIGNTYDSMFGVGTDKEQAGAKIEEYGEYLLENGYTTDGRVECSVGYELFVKDDKPSLLVGWLSSVAPEEGQPYVMHVILYEVK